MVFSATNIGMYHSVTIGKSERESTLIQFYIYPYDEKKVSIKEINKLLYKHELCEKANFTLRGK